MIKKLSTFLAFVVLIWPPTVGPNQSQNSQEKSTALQAPPEMRRLSEAFVGDWRVSENFEIDSTKRGMAREGTASFRLGAGASLVEDYHSNGSAGNLQFLALLWWDRSTRVYRLLTCANNDGCELRGSARWDGDTLVNSWQEDVQGQTATFKDSFTDITPSSFRLVSEGTAGAKVIWRVVTRYTRIRESKAELGGESSFGVTARNSPPTRECITTTNIGRKRFEEVMQTVAEGWNAGNARLAASCFAENAVYSGPPSIGHYGRQALYKFFGGDKGRDLPMRHHDAERVHIAASPSRTLTPALQ